MFPRLTYKGCRLGVLRKSPGLCPAKKRSRLPISPAVKTQGATPARRAAGRRAEVHPRSRSRKPGGPSSLVTQGLKGAMAGSQGHARGQLWQAVARRRSGDGASPPKATPERGGGAGVRTTCSSRGVRRALIGWSASRYRKQPRPVASETKTTAAGCVRAGGAAPGARAERAWGGSGPR